VVDYGGIVSPDGQNFLKCARSLGDAKYKVGPRSQHLICAEPDVFRRELTDEDDIIVMGSDGVWDVLSDQKACEIALKALKENPGKPHLAAKAVALGAYQAESEDNICAAVLLLKRRPGPEPEKLAAWSATASRRSTAPAPQCGLSNATSPLSTAPLAAASAADWAPRAETSSMKARTKGRRIHRSLGKPIISGISP
jgi:hypothetical protein